MRAPLVVLACVLCAQGAWARKPAYPEVKHGGLYMFNYYFPPAPSATPWAPCWSPDGKWIAVGMQGAIWKVDPSSGAATELVADGRYNSSPDWSPDGKWIIYTADNDGRDIQLGILNVATGESRLLTEGGHVYLDPVFSPDGGRIAYVSSIGSGHLNIYVRPIRDGQWTGEAVPLTTDRRSRNERLYVSGWDMHTQPAWTPDGKQILFVWNRDAALGSGDLFRMPVEPEGVLKAAPVLREQTLFRTRPHVSPDGKRIIYTSSAGAAEQYNNLYVLPVEGGTPYKMTFAQFDYFHPRWSPDGEWIAAAANEGGLPQLCVIETYGGARRTVRITSRKWKRAMGTLRVRVVDAATGRPTAARIHGLAADSKFYAPTDAYVRLGLVTDRFFHTPGEFTVETPPGRMTLNAVKGFEYKPTEAEVEVVSGRVSEVEIKLERLVNLQARGWYSGTTHVHMNYGGNLQNTPENLVFMGQAEDLNAVMDQVANKDNRIFDQQFFIGPGEHPASTGTVKLHIGQEYRPPFYGHVFFLGLKSHLISPFTTGYEGTGIESLYPSNTDMFRKARAQGALTAYVHPFVSTDTDPLDTGLGVARALPVDTAFGLLDALEWSYSGKSQLGVWHKLLDNDLVLPPVGGEDSINNLHHYRVMGSFRTYAHLDGPLTVPGWLDAIRQGRTYMTSGPLVEFRINGQEPGGSVRLPAGGGEVTVEGSVRSIVPLTRLVIHSGGQAVKEIPLEPGGLAARFSERIRVETSAWFSLYAEGPPSSYLDAEYPIAITNAIRVYTGDRKIRNRASAEYFVKWIDKLRASAEQWRWWRSEREKRHVLSQFEEAQHIYRRLAAEAQQ